MYECHFGMGEHIKLYPITKEGTEMKRGRERYYCSSDAFMGSVVCL